ncbi:MAG: hypothetical protein A2283_01075 [Lentisphaerae bacterium RIFOXYA12_FULL_48_11]|nr:MAG: hypothetical protein A2283_01075 [Lentisphaerae bacterium RIFOXYA12_FULL_48_11]
MKAMYNFGQLGTITLFILCFLNANIVKSASSSDVVHPQKASPGFSETAKKAIPAVVFLKVEKSINLRMGSPNGYNFNNPYDYFGDELLERFFGGGMRNRRPMPKEFKQQGQGSGFLISKDGFILTNNHVVGDADKITVRLHDGREFAAKKIGSDPKTEVAVIKIEGENFPYLKMGDSAALEIGEWVIAVGNPFGLSETLTVGVVSAKGRSGMGIADYEDFIQTDAAINPGNSGGPLLNIDAEVVGINTAIYSQNGGSMGIGFAIPINMAKNIKDQIVKSGKVIRSYIGVYPQEITSDMADALGIKDHQGIIISNVMKGSPAEKAGIKHGDIIVKLNGQDVKSPVEFRNEVSSKAPGTKLNVTISRDGKEEKFSITTAELQDDSVAGAGVLTFPEGEKSIEKLGINVKNLSKELAERFEIDLEYGVVIVEVDPDSDAARAGIQAGHVITGVNTKSVSNVTEFKKALESAKKRVLLRITDGRMHYFVPLKID